MTGIASTALIVLGLIFIIAAVVLTIVELVQTHTLSYDSIILDVVLAIVGAIFIAIGAWIGTGKTFNITK